MNEIERYHRNSQLIDQKLLDEITVIGLGSIGSELVSQLAIMGWDFIHIWDNDILELHNLSTTKYHECHLKMPKALAATKTIHAFNSKTKIIGHNERFTTHCISTPITIVCTDSIRSRKTAYKEWIKLPNAKLFIDVRMDSLTMQVITITPYTDKWEEFYVKDEDIADAPCTMKHTIFTSSLAAGHAVKQLFLVLMGHPYYIYEWHGFCPTIVETKYLVIPEGDDNATEETS